jgi:hypothetical protein
MSKTVAFRMPAPKSAAADHWVDEGVEAHLKPAAAPVSAPVIVKRLTLDIPAELHARVKLACVQRDKTMLDEIIRLLEAEFPASS